MTAIYVLPCWLEDLDNDVAEIYRTKPKAMEICSRCFNVDGKCPHEMELRCPRRMVLTLSGLEQREENCAAEETPQVIG